MAFMQRWLGPLRTLLWAPQPQARDEATLSVQPATPSVQPLTPININPTSGLPMVGGNTSVDVSGTPYGMLPQSVEAAVMPVASPADCASVAHDATACWDPAPSLSFYEPSYDASAPSWDGGGWDDWSDPGF